MEAESQEEAVQEGLNAGHAHGVGEKGRQAGDGECAKQSLRDRGSPLGSGWRNNGVWLWGWGGRDGWQERDLTPPWDLPV